MPQLSFKSLKALIFGFALSLLLFFHPATLESVQGNGVDSAPAEAGIVLLGDQKVLEFKASLGTYSAEERAVVVNQRLKKIANNSQISPESIKVIPDPVNQQTVMIVAGSGANVILALTQTDAKAANQSVEQLANHYVTKIQAAIQNYRSDRSLKSILLAIVYALLATVGVSLVWNLTGRFFTKIYQYFHNLQKGALTTLRLGRFQLLPTSPLIEFALRLLNLVRLSIYFAITYIYLSLVLSFFPGTRGFGNIFLGGLLSAATSVFRDILAYLPNLFFIGIIVFIAYEIADFIRLIFNEIERGNISLPWLYPDWIKPTYNLILFLIIMLSIAIGLPYIPGYRSSAFQGVSLILGALLTLGSTGVASNIIGGVIVIYTRAFQIGDRVQIGDAMGDIIGKNLLVTRLRTPKNMVVTIPNSTIINSSIVNFSKLVREPDQEKALILYTTITLGYDVPWRNVHEALIQAALATPGVLAEPAPFVLQTALNDSNVSYEINAYTNLPNQMSRIYSELNQNIQDFCNQVGIEIMSPLYLAMRDGNHSTMPANYLPEDYQAPGFRVDTNNLRQGNTQN